VRKFCNPQFLADSGKFYGRLQGQRRTIIGQEKTLSRESVSINGWIGGGRGIRIIGWY
jgi:hypothetical protein